MDKQTAESLRDLAVQYPLWALLDWMRDTETGKLFAASGLGAIMTGLGRVVAGVRGWQPNTKHTLSIILITCAWIFSVVGLATWLSAPQSPPSAIQAAPVPVPAAAYTPLPKSRWLNMDDAQRWEFVQDMITENPGSNTCQAVIMY
jgi:hypothetical protein